MSEPIVDLAELIGDLEAAAAELRAGELDAEGAAAMVERCADLAGSIASELDRQVRELDAEPPDQESLL